jgi:hypothetical protein
MLPILIMPDSPTEPEDEILLETGDSATESADLYEIEDLWEEMPQEGRRGRTPLGSWVEIRHRIPRIAEGSDSPPARLQDCDQFLKLLLRRKAGSMKRGQREELRRVMHTTGIGSETITTLSPETGTWLLWRSEHASSARLAAAPCTHAGRSMVDQHADESVLRSGRSASAGIRGMGRAAVSILVASGDMQTRGDEGCARSADGQNQIHAADAEHEFHRDDREFAGETDLRELGMRKFANE